MSESKKCPKCGKNMIAQLACILPAILDPTQSKLAISSDKGIPIQPYHCDSCGYIEIYHRR